MPPESPGVVVFPGAGSFGGELLPLLSELGPTAWLARYPGRFGKDLGRPAGSFEDIVQSCVAQVTRRQSVRPILVGHSFGAYVARATATRLEELGTGVCALVVVGATAPGLLTVPESATRSPSGTAAYFDEIDPGLVPGEVSDEWRDIVLETAMQDLRLLKDFTATASASEYTEVHCPVFAARGEADPLASADGIGRWAGVTSADCVQRVFPGSHSGVLRSPEFTSWLVDVCATAPQTSSGPLGSAMPTADNL
ncbi:thioesterase II family protein [Streptomyces sp. NPDC001513]|uniref:thioesterase II family protein n=1 Tax=Streptomyces sp. NPDC001513 TaxID=3364580 RepID=UPI003689B3C3